MGSAATTERDPRQEWATPNDFYSVIRDEFCPDLDVCATQGNSKCGLYIGPPGYDPPDSPHGPRIVANDGLLTEWMTFDSVMAPRCFWCNPGFGNVTPWMMRCVEESSIGGTVLLLTHASHAEWAQLGWRNAAECRLLVPRIQFEPASGIKPSSNSRDGFLWVFRPYYSGPCNIFPWHWNKADNQ